MAFCENCGNQLNAGERFCTNCGTQVAAAPPRPAAPPAAPAPPPPTAQQEPPQPMHSMGSSVGGMGAAAGGAVGGVMGGGTGGQPPQIQHAPMQQQAAQQQTGTYDNAAEGQPSSAKSIKEMFFTYRGRLNRKPFILRGFLLSILSSMMSTVMAEMTEASSVVMHLFALVPLILMVVLGVGGFMLIIRRWHDLGKSGWLSLLMLVPLFNFFVLIFLWVKKGTDGPNTYGDDPLA